MRSSKKRSAFTRVTHKEDREKSVRGGYYITDTFQKLQCTHYIPQAHDALNWCKCGHDSDHHARYSKACFKEGSDDPSVEWNVSTHTQTLPTDAFGEINFVLSESDVLPLYLRCKIDTDVGKLSDLLLNRWQLPKPNLLMSVFGGHGKFDSTEIDSEEVQKGIVNAAKTTNAWIFTSGVDVGVSQLVGNAISKKRTFVNSIPVIGINSWGAVRNNEDLVNSIGLFPAHYEDKKWQAEHDKQGCIGLENDHTHFLLLDCGTRYNFNETEIRQFRIDFQKEIVSQSEAHLVSIMVEGGIGSLREARTRIEHNLPVLILGNSGRISNVISEAFEKSIVSSTTDGITESVVRAISEEDKYKVMDSLMSCIPDKTEEQYEAYYEDIEFIIRNDNMVTIWCVGTDEDLDKAILTALIKSLTSIPDNKKKTLSRGLSQAEIGQAKRKKEVKLLSSQLELAIQWDRLDLAQDYIFRNMTMESKKLNDFLFLALQHRRDTFVRYLIDMGASVKYFLTEARFEEMLNDVEKSTLLYRLMSNVKHKGCDGFIYEHFAAVVKHISTGVFYCPEKKKPTKDDPEYVRQCMSHSFLDKACVHWCKKTCCGCGKPQGKGSRCPTTRYTFMNSNHELGVNAQSPDSKDQWETVFTDPENLLVIYYILIHEQDMAKLFWEYSRTPVFLAIVCSNIHKWMAEQEKTTIEITSDLKDRLEGHAEEFEEMAYDVLDEVAKSYPPKWTRVLVEHEFTNWGGLTILEMADYTKSVKVIAHSAVQDIIDENWMGLLDPDLSYLRLFISLPCPWLANYRYAKPSDGLDNTVIADKNMSKFSQARRISFVDHKQNEATGLPTERSLTALEKLKVFYHAPVTKFMIYITTYLCFLAGYSMALLLVPHTEDGACEDHGGLIMKTVFNCKLGTAEAIIYVWIFSIMPLEIRQLYDSYPTTFRGKIKDYCKSLYNKIDILSMVLVVIAFVFKNYETEEYDGVMTQNWMHNMFRFFFSCAFVLYCIRLCQAMQINAELGPKVMMIASMLQDLVFFIGIVAVCIVAYGVSTEALINPNRGDISIDMIFYLIWRPYINLFGEFGTEEIQERMNLEYCFLNADSTYNCEEIAQDIDYCQEDGVCQFNFYAVHIFLGIYMMLAAVLMLNLLVAVFSSTYEKIQDNSGECWKMQKFDLMNEFCTRSAIPFPFSSAYYIILFVKWVWRNTFGELCGLCCKRKADSSESLDEHGDAKVMLLESECRRNYLERASESEPDVREDVKQCLKTIDNLQTKINGFEESMQNVIDRSVQNTSLRVASLPMRRSPSPSYNPPTDDEHMYEILDGLTSLIEEDAPVVHAAPPAVTENGGGRRGSSFKDVVKKGKVNALANFAKISKRTRTDTYPGTTIRRVHVKNEHWSWLHPVISYNPVNFTASNIAAEKNLGAINWNKLENSDDRRSYEGVYQVVAGVPLNPCGRTGLCGRGKLAKWGPNHVAMPIITRYAHNEAGEKVFMSGKPLLETLLHKRGNDLFGLPESCTNRDDPLSEDIRDLFQEHHLTSENMGKTMKRISKVLNSGVLIFRGYLDSEYNTDNSWLESIIVSYHDVHDNTFTQVEFPEGADYVWCQVKHTTLINNSYRGFLQKAFYARSGYDYVQFPEGSPMNRMF